MTAWRAQIRIAGLLFGWLAVFQPLRAAETSPGDAPTLADVTMNTTAQANEGVRVIPIERGRLRATLSAMARVDVDGAHSITIRPAGDGKISEILVTPGQTVRQGQPLIRYVDHTLHILALQEQQARAGLATAQANLVAARQAYRRGVALQGGAVAVGEVVHRRAQMQEQTDAVTARQADIGMIEHRLHEEFTSPTERILHGEDSELIAPVDGVVQALPVGITTDIGPQTVVASLADLSSVWAVAEIPPEDAARVEVGGTMRVTPAGSADATTVTARISTVDGIANPATGLTRVVSVVTGAPGLRPGMMLTATLDTHQQAEGWRVPLAAVQRIGGRDIIFVQTGPERFSPRPVTVRLETADAAIVEGAPPAGDLAAGDRIVTDGSFALKSIALLSSLSD